MFYVIKLEDQSNNKREFFILDKPPVKNPSGQEPVIGWVCTFENVRAESHGEFETRNKAKEKIADIVSKNNISGHFNDSGAFVESDES